MGRCQRLLAGVWPHGTVTPPAQQTRKGQGCELTPEVQNRVLVGGDDAGPERQIRVTWRPVYVREDPSAGLRSAIKAHPH